MTPEAIEHLTIQTSVDVPTIAIQKHPGTGPEVLLIHGISSSSADFAPVIAQMSDFCQPITIDLRGHGGSTKPESGYHYADYVGDLECVIAKLGLLNPIIIGHSLGGIITLMWAAQNPDSARALIIEDSPLRSGSDFGEAFEGWLMLNALPHEAARAWYASKNPSWPQTLLDQRSFDMVNTARAAILELQATSLANEGLDSFAGLDQISSPLLFLQGESAIGSMVVPDDVANLQRMIPQMGVKLFPEAGHTIHRSHPEEWLQTVREFIESLNP